MLLVNTSFLILIGNKLQTTTTEIVTIISIIIKLYRKMHTIRLEKMQQYYAIISNMPIRGNSSGTHWWFRNADAYEKVVWIMRGITMMRKRDVCLKCLTDANVKRNF